MPKIILFIVCILLQQLLIAQKKNPAAITIPMTADKWEVQPQTVTFLEHKGVPALQILDSRASAILKDLNFSSGTIEFDIEPQDPRFTGIFFRRQSDEESEYFYLRVEGGSIPGATWAIQYAPIIKSINLWDMLPWYQGPATFKQKEWSHVKLVVSGAQLLVYMNDMIRPVMEVPKLEGNTASGGLAFNGKAIIANLVVKPGEVAGLLPAEGIDPTAHDPRYIRQWSVTQPAALPYGRELFARELPKPGTAWDTISAERRGLVNLTRRFGIDTTTRRMVWLKVKLKSATEQQRRVDFGFSDEVWVFLNGGLAYVDKNIFTSPGMKEPKGRCAVENTSFTLPLKAGENELLIGLSNDFYGWGIIARLDNMETVEVIKE